MLDWLLYTQAIPTLRFVHQFRRFLLKSNPYIERNDLFCVCLVLNGKIHCRKFSYSPSIEYAWHFSARIIYDFRLNRTEPIKSSEKQSYTGTKAMCNFNCISLFPLYSNWFVFDFLRVSDIVFRNNGLDSKRNISFWIGASLHLFVQSFSLSLDKCFALGFFPALFWRWLPE